MESIADFIKRTAKERQQQNAAAAGIVLNTTDKNPDDVALNLNLANDWAKTTGKPVPPLPLVEEYRPVFQKQINDKQNSTILADAPKLSEWLKNPDNAALAQDDLPGLSWWERLPNSFRMGTATGIKQGQEFTKDVGMVLERGALGQGLDALGKEFDQLVLTNDQGTPNLLGQLANYARSLSTAQDKIPRRMVGGPDVTPNQRADAIENADLGQLYKGATALLSEMEKNGFSPMSYKDVGSLSGAAQFISENLATSLPHTVASIASGGLSLLVQVISLGGEANAELKERTDLSVKQRTAIATGAGILMAGLDYFGMSKIFGGVPVKTVVSEALEGTLVERLIQNGVSKAVGRILEAAIAEGTTETLQEAISIGVSAISGGQYTAQEVIDRLLQAFTAGSATGATMRTGFEAIGGSFGAAINQMKKNEEKTAAATDAQDLIAKMAGQATQSKLRKRMPDVFRAWVERATENGPVENLYVPADKFTQYFQSIGIDPYKMVDEMHGVTRDELKTALETGSDLRIPTATYAASLAGSKADQFFMENMRFDPDEFTSAEARAFEETKAELMAQAYAEAERTFREEQDLRTFEEEIYDTMVERLRMSGRATEVATTEAMLYPAFYRTMAERSNLSVQELMRRYPLPQVRGDIPQGIQPKNVDDLTRMLATARATRSADVNQPKTPLLEWIAARGGIDDTSGELAARNAAEIKRGKGRKTLRLARALTENGKPIITEQETASGKRFGWDDVSQAAVEAGFLADDPRVLEWQNAQRDGTPAPDLIPALMEAIDAELRGEAQLTIHEMRAGPTQDDMLAELDQYLAEIGVTLDDTDEDIREAIEKDQNKRRQIYKQAEVSTLAKINTHSLLQQQRGSIAFPTAGVGNGETIISLFRKADLSTFIHETGHYFLTIMQDLAEQNEPNSIADFKTVKSWWRQNAHSVAKDAMSAMPDLIITPQEVITLINNGTTNNAIKDAAINVGMQEQFARGFEAYLMEGKSPSIELQNAFEKFRAWLVSIYKQITKLNVELSPDIREVFNRLLATDAEIKDAKSKVGDAGPMFKTGENPGLSQEDWELYQKIAQQAHLDAASKTLVEAMAPIKREAEPIYKAEKEKLHAEIEPMVNARREYRAIEWMGNRRWLGGQKPKGLPDMRMSRRLLVERYGEGVLKTLPRGKLTLYTNSGGVDPEIAAGLFGFSSADEMIRALETAPARTDMISSEVERVMFERHGDALKDGTIEAKALEAVHGDKRARLLALELDILNAKPDGTKSAVSTFREMARRSLVRMPVRDAMAANRYLTAERKAGETSYRAFSNGDLASAAEAKRRQLLNYMLYSEARKIQAEVEAAEKLTARLQKKSTRDKLAGDYLDAIDEILNRYDFRRLSARAQDRRGALMAYVERMKADGRENELAISNRVLQDAARIPYKRLSVEHLRGVIDSLKNIEHTARLKKTLQDAQSQRNLDAVVEEILDEFDENLPQRPPGRVPTQSEKLKAAARQFLDLVLNSTTILREIDGFKDFGPAYQNIKGSIDEAMNRLQTRREKAAIDLNALYEVYSKTERRKMALREYIPKLGISMSKWERIAVALNTGNDGNYQRITDITLRGGFTNAQVTEILEGLDERDAHFVQSVWDYLDTFRIDIAAREKRLTGVTPKWIEARPVTIAGIKLRGGYYPLKYDPRLSALARDDQANDIAKSLQAGRFGKAQTKNGHLKERASASGRAVELDISVLHRHVQQVVYDLELSEPVTNSWRILQNARIREAFIDAGKLADFDALEIWLKDVAEGELAASEVAGQMARRFKSNFTAAKLAFNLSTVALQITGVAQSMVVVGKADFLRGVQASLRRGVAQEITAKSRFMNDRQTTFNKDIFDLYNDPKIGPVATKWQEIRNEWIAPAGFWLMTKVQFYAVDVPTWMAGYHQGLRQSGGNEQKAIAHADNIVKRAAASGLWSDRSAIERGSANMRTRQSEFLRLFTTLGSYMFAKFNVAYERSQRARAVIQDEGLTKRSAVEALSWSIDVAFLFTLEAVLFAAIKGGLPDEDDDKDSDGMTDEWAAFLAKQTGMSFVGTIPFLRDIGSVLTGFGGGGAYGAITEELAKPIVQMGQGEIDKALVKSIINATGLFTGLPAGQINRAVDAGWRKAEGEDVSILEYMLGRIGK